MKKLRVGVIGIGDISNVYLNNLKKYDAVEVVACASRGLEKAQRKAAEHGIPKAYASGMELIADPDIDIILNLTTPQAHYEYNLAALKAGKHVYTEKPLAMTFEQGGELVSLAKEKGLLIGCAPDTFLGGRLQNIRELIDSGRLGRITGGGAWFVGHGHEFHHPAPAFFYQPGAGPLYDMERIAAEQIGTGNRILFINEHRALGTVNLHARQLGIPYVKTAGQRHLCPAHKLENRVDMSIHVHRQHLSLARARRHSSRLPCLSGHRADALYRAQQTEQRGDVIPLMRTPDQYRWADAERRPENVNAPWPVVPNSHPYNSVSHAENPRGIGLVDLVYALEEGRKPRASGEMALHSLEVMECILKSAHEHVFCEPTTTFEQPKPLDWQ